MKHRIRRGVLLLSLVALGCGGTNAAPGEDGGLRPCTDDDQCLANETCALGYCQPGAQKDAAPDAAPGALQVTPSAVVDFGSPAFGSEVERQVTLQNVGGVTLVVNSVDLTENDATKEYSLAAPTTPFELQPGASQVLTVRLKTVDGELDQGQLIINSTDYSHPTIILQLVTATKGAVDLEMCVEKTSPTDCEDPPAFPLGQLSYGVAATRTFHVRATGQGTPVIDAQSITLLSSGGLTSTHYQLQLYYRHPSPTDPSQTIEDATALAAGDFPKILSAGDENTAPAEIRGVLTFDSLVSGPVPSESVSVQTDAGNVVAPVSGQVSGCAPGTWDLDGDSICEYTCTYQSATDDPDDNFVDANCDGIDGEIAKAIFVAPPPKGDDTTGTGTMAAPYATVTKGIQAAASASKKQIFIAAGTYAENVTLVDGISLYGGYDSSTAFWQRAVGNDSAIIGHALGNADEVTVRASGLTKATTLDRLIILSAPANAGFSSYAVMVTNVPANLLTISNCEIHAGNGGLGTDGGNGSNGQGGSNGSNGGAGLEYGCAAESWQPLQCQLACGVGGSMCNTGTIPVGGAGGGSNCSRTGGTGATGGNSGQGGQTGSSGASGGGAGGAGGADVHLPGSAGADGAVGSNGTTGQKGLSFGAVTAAGYSVSSGTSGTAGGHGAGGGGGGSGGGDAPYWVSALNPACCASAGGSGGGGGGGGCGGGTGTYGRGGGGSFGIYLYNSSPNIKKCSIYSGNGGAGGRGGTGGNGGLASTGGAGGAGVASPSDPPEATGDGGKGGNGGKGGTGGHGGGGGGGPSIGVLEAGGASPTIDTSTQIHIFPGSGGQGGTSPDSAASGQAGISATVQTM